MLWHWHRYWCVNGKRHTLTLRNVKCSGSWYRSWWIAVSIRYMTTIHCEFESMLTMVAYNVRRLRRWRFSTTLDWWETQNWIQQRSWISADGTYIYWIKPRLGSCETWVLLAYVGTRFVVDVWDGEMCVWLGVDDEQRRNSSIGKLGMSLHQAANNATTVQLSNNQSVRWQAIATKGSEKRRVRAAPLSRTCTKNVSTFSITHAPNPQQPVSILTSN